MRLLINKAQIELCEGVHNLNIYPNAAYARAFGPLSCTYLRVRAHTCACMRMCACMLCTCLCVRACAYVCACVVYMSVCVYSCVRTCVRCARVRVFAYVCARVLVRACTCGGIEDALPLGVFPPQERAQAFCPPGGLVGRLGRLSRPVPVA